MYRSKELPSFTPNWFCVQALGWAGIRGLNAFVTEVQDGLKSNNAFRVKIEYSRCQAVGDELNHLLTKSGWTRLNLRLG